VRRTRGELVVTRVPDLTEREIERSRVVELRSPVVELVETTLAKVGSVGLIVPDAMLSPVVAVLSEAGLDFAILGEEDPATGTEVGGEEYAARLDVVPASLAKGLEFDHVVLLEPAGIVSGEADRLTGLRRLYVCLTRAVTSLAVLHAEDLPPELGTPPA
jgi:superfamily I DNA/RNA helicase